eukprot:m.187689 g.187689  ORF g.187689 m.187689 type:complete len:90 (-) comp13627_c0_seq5:3717-3986(-)
MCIRSFVTISLFHTFIIEKEIKGGVEQSLFVACLFVARTVPHVHGHGVNCTSIAFKTPDVVYKWTVLEVATDERSFQSTHSANVIRGVI